MGFLKKLFGGSTFPYVYVNQDGSARELSPNERKYLSAEFSGADGGRPYVKASYDAKDGWGSQSGYLQRRHLPRGLTIAPVNPDYDAAVKEFDKNFMEKRHDAERAAGDTVTVHPNGMVTTTPKPGISPKERFELIRAYTLGEQRKREALAKIE